MMYQPMQNWKVNSHVLVSQLHKKSQFSRGSVLIFCFLISKAFSPQKYFSIQLPEASFHQPKQSVAFYTVKGKLCGETWALRLPSKLAEKFIQAIKAFFVILCLCNQSN